MILGILVFTILLYAVMNYRFMKATLEFGQDSESFLFQGLLMDSLSLILIGLPLLSVLVLGGGPGLEVCAMLGFLAVGAHFIPRVLVFSALSLEEVSSRLEGESRDRLREGVIEFAESSVREEMVPINDVFKISEQVTLGEILEMPDYRPYSRIPVYKDQKDNIVGVVYARELIDAAQKGDTTPWDCPVGPWVREAYFVPELMEQSALLQELKKRKIQIAIVVDEFGVITGIVTLEDVIETIVGEVQDRRNDNDTFVHQSGARDWDLDAMIELDDFSELVAKDFVSDLVETLGGFIFLELGSLPAAGDSVVIQGLEFTVTEMERHRIRRLSVRELKS
jgi:CBS domain containing-hemolysin-like protein